MARIAIIGAGIAGLSAADRLHAAGHVLDIYEAGDHVGGHTATVDVDGFAIDTGFIVWNQLTYPRFSRLLSRLGVASHATDMTFGVRDDRSGVEYACSDLGGVFAQRRRLLDPRHWQMLAEIVRFNAVSRELLDDDTGETIASYLARRGFSATFRDRFLIPMGAAIWSAPAGELADFPARGLVEFFTNHRFLDLLHRPVWRVVTGGSREYVRALIRPFAERIRLRTPVARVVRRPGEVLVDGERFDHVVIACHSDQALRLLAEPTALERAVLGAIAYQDNDVVLHTDTSCLPRARRAWAAWNYHVTGDAGRPATVTYDLTRLQGLATPTRYLVTLNETGAIDPRTIRGRYRYAHPLYSLRARDAQARWHTISGGRTHYAGAYWFHGFHEDGARSGERAAEGVLAAIAAPIEAVA